MPKGKGYGTARSKFVPKANKRIKRKEAEKLGVPIARNPNLRRTLHNLTKARRKRK